MSMEMSYLDMELYLNYSILISSDIPIFIMSICDNLIDCNAILKKNKISYMYRIPLDNLESGEKISYKKYFNNDDFFIPENTDEKSIDNLYYIVYHIKNNQIFPLKICKTIIDASKYVKTMNKNNNLYIIGMKTNKIYNSILDYEYLSINAN